MASVFFWFDFCLTHFGADVFYCEFILPRFFSSVFIKFVLFINSFFKLMAKKAQHKTVASRFIGRGGKAKLVESLMSQALIGGNNSLAERIAGKVIIQDVKKNKYISKQGASENDIYFLLSGEIVIEVNGRQIAQRISGEHIGEMAMVDNTAVRSASLKANEQCVIAKLSELEFAKIAKNYPDLWRRIAVILAKRLRDRNKFHVVPRTEPSVFIGSSKEGLEIAQCIKKYLSYHPIVVKLWSQGVFEVSKTAIESLTEISTQVDFAIIILTPDDITTSRGKKKNSPRDNAIFELGLFMGAIGRKRTFIVCPQNTDIKIPTDLLGVTQLNYNLKKRNSLSRNLKSLKSSIRKHIDEIGPS